MNGNIPRWLRAIARNHKKEKWTLFLDRDGTINKLLVNDYVKDWESFHFIEGVPDAIAILNTFFDLTIVVTNQQGIGKKLMEERALRQMHVKMLDEIMMNGGYIDEIYYSPDLDDGESTTRKPAPGMGLQAKADFPAIHFSRAVMIGDAPSDMEFGKKLGMKTVMLTQYRLDFSDEIMKNVDFKEYDLPTFAETLLSLKK